MTNSTSTSAPDGPCIWIDGDAVPRACREILFRANQTRRVPMVVVANHWQEVPRRTSLRMVQVAQGADVADTYIVDNLGRGDLVVSGDIPLAARAVERGATVLQPRGLLLDASNVREHLSIRDFNEELRSGGVMTGGQAPFDTVAQRNFANALDRWITRAGASRPLAARTPDA